MSRRIFVMSVLVVGLAAVLFASQRRRVPATVSGFVEADEIRVGSRVGGRVARVLAIEGARVQPGEVLVELEPFDLEELRSQSAALLAQRKEELKKLKSGFRQEEIAQAKFRVDQLKAQFDQLKNGPRKQEIRAGEAQLQLAEAEYERAKFQLQLTEALFAKKAATSDQLDQAKTDLKVARSASQVRTEELNLLKEGARAEELEQAEAKFHEAEEAWKLQTAGYSSEEIAAAEAAVLAAEATLAAADRKLDELKIRAPLEGWIESVELQPGDLVAANAPVLSMIDLARLRVRAYVPENRMNLKPDQKLQVTVDSFPERTFEGTVTFLSRQAEFTPGNVQTPEERSKQVFRIRVELADPGQHLRPGMSADVRLPEVSE